MKHWLYHYERINGAPSELEATLRHRIQELIATATGTTAAERTPEGDVLVRLPARTLGHDVHKMVRVRTGVAERRELRTCIPLQWHADPGRHLFPSFDGTIELDPKSSSSAHLAIVGAADLPLGALGAAADATALRGLADRTVRDLVLLLARALEDAVEPPEPAPPTAAETPRELTVRDVMTPLPLVLHEHMPLKTAALLLFHYEVSGAPVQSDTGALVGVLSEADLMDVEAPLRYGLGRDADDARRRKESASVGEACTRPVVQVAATTAVRDAAALMRDRDVARLVVVDHSAIAGIVARHDVLRALIREDAETQRALRGLLTDLGQPHVTASVEWGVAVLRGRVTLRSAATELLDKVEDLDGVIEVDADLDWEVDDVLPPVVPMM